jgi:hypothetical protein
VSLCGPRWVRDAFAAIRLEQVEGIQEGTLVKDGQMQNR